MAKTQEELEQLKQEYKTLTVKLKELTDEELEIVTGGVKPEVRDFSFGVEHHF